eukprot:TRINITY_DN6350_c1_g1_i2.p1 TRINITY_DN6350_c1_g1~~TRINITY_DN6350_c1_g1_i2.p1  ORF type:complete len:928 (+),score=313.13 TRINITY_DN6350_c1_g1_i2:35-2785(+)
MGHKGSKSAPNHTPAGDGIAPHDVLFEVSRHHVHCFKEGGGGRERARRVAEEVEKQRSVVAALKKKGKKSEKKESRPNDIEAGGKEEAATAKQQASVPPFVPKHGYAALPADHRQTVMTIEGKGGAHNGCIYIPSTSEVSSVTLGKRTSFLGTATYNKRRQSVATSVTQASTLNEHALGYLQEGLRLKRAAMESDIYEVAGVRPLRLYAHDHPEKMQRTTLEPWDLDALLSPPAPAPESEPSEDGSVVSAPSTRDGEPIILFPNRKPAMETAVVAALPLVVAAYQQHLQNIAAEEERKRVAEVERQEQGRVQQRTALEGTEAAARDIICKEATQLGHMETAFLVGKRDIVAKGHEAAVQASLAKERSVSPHVFEHKTPTRTFAQAPALGTSPLLSAGATPHEMHKRMKQMEAQVETERKLALQAALAMPIAEEETQRAIIERIHEEELEEVAQQCRAEFKVLEAKRLKADKDETEAMLAKVESKIAKSAAPVVVHALPSEDVPTATPKEEPKGGKKKEKKEKKDETSKRRKQLSKELNEWKQRFEAEHGKPPTKKHMKADPQIAAIHEEYQALKEKKSPASPTGPQPAEPPAEPDAYEVPPRVGQGWQSASDLGNKRYAEDEDAADTEVGRPKDDNEVEAVPVQEEVPQQEEAQQQEQSEVGPQGEEAPQERQDEEALEQQETPREKQEEELPQPQEEAPQTEVRQEAVPLQEEEVLQQQQEEAPEQEAPQETQEEGLPQPEEEALQQGMPSPEEGGRVDAVDGGTEEDRVGDEADEGRRDDASTPTVLEVSPESTPATPIVKPKARRAELVNTLNAWKAEFAEKHGREPSKKDIKTDPVIAPVYEEYSGLGKEKKEKKLDRKKEVVKELNAWKAAYEAEHGRQPKKKDMMGSEVRELYAEYLEIMKEKEGKKGEG